MALLKELDTSRIRNAWYASELELARKAGYTPSTTLSPALESRAANDTLDDEDKSLVEALFAMRAELGKVQASVDQQAYQAGRQVAEAEAQRDAAIREAVYAKAKLSAAAAAAAGGGGGAAMGAAHGDGRGSLDSTRGEGDPDPDSTTHERTQHLGRKLATALHSQRDLQSQLDAARAELESERRARALADETAEAVQRRTAELEAYRQQHSADVDSLKAELHEAQKGAREQNLACAEATAALELLRAEMAELRTKYDAEVDGTRNHGTTIATLRNAMAASTESATHAEKRHGEERSRREQVEAELSQLKSEYEARTAELVATTQRLRDTQETADKHAREAETHRQIVFGGLDRMAAAGSPRNGGEADDGHSQRMATLERQLAAAAALARKHQLETDTAEDKLRRAEERISGLETYMDSTSREGVAMRKQLQAAMREIQTLLSSNADLRNALAAQQLETNAMTVQHNALKDILGERGISPTTNAAAAARAGSRGGSGSIVTGTATGSSLNSPRMTPASPEHTRRLHDLESQLVAVVEAHEDTKRQLSSQLDESEVAYRDKLAQLENDYQSAVQYVKGTERMLKKLQDQLTRYRAENERLNHELDSRTTDGGHEAELTAAHRDRDAALNSSNLATQRLATHRRDVEQLQHENALLEQRVLDAEGRVALLLDQVESSVDNYRRLSRQPATNGHVRTESAGTEPDADTVAPGSGSQRNSVALEGLASELESLRSHWETTSRSYRLSNAFEFEAKGGDEGARA